MEPVRGATSPSERRTTTAVRRVRTETLAPLTAPRRPTEVGTVDREPGDRSEVKVKGRSGGRVGEMAGTGGLVAMARGRFVAAIEGIGRGAAEVLDEL